MRTTLHIDEDVYHAAKSLAEAERTTVGRILSRLARKALQPPSYITSDDGIPAFRVSDAAAPLTPRMVKEAGEDS